MVKVKKSYLFLIILSALFILPGIILAEGESPYLDNLDKTINYYRYNKTSLTDWQEAVGLAEAGEDLSNQEQWQLPDWDVDNLSDDLSALKCISSILGLNTIGEDPTNFNGRNLVQELSDIQEADGSFGDHTRVTYWSIIALDEVGGNYDVAGAVEFLLSQQNDNGGFSWIDKATTPDSDSTGTALMALANHRGIDGVEEAIENSINYLKGIQKDDGGFGTSAGAEVNCNSTACVVMGLLACGENIVSDDWLKNGNSMINALLSFQLENGSFSHIAGTPSNELATKQALMALVRIVKSGVGGTNDSENPGDDESSEDKTVRVRVEGHTTNLADEVVTVNGTAMDALKAAVGEDQLEAPGGFITTIKGESGQNGIVEGINTSWMYYVIRNGEIEPGSFDLGAGDYNVEDGDEIIFYLGAMDALTWTPKTYLPQLNITPSNVTAGQTLTINISAKKYVWPDGLSDLTPEEAQAVGDYTVQAGENTYTSSYGQVTIPNISAGTWDFIITNSCDQGYPDVVTLAKSIVVGPVEDKTVRVRVEGHATSLANETVTVRGTALDALKAAVGEDQLVAPGGFITTIKGESGQVGIVEGINTSWMYYVIRNGEIEPGAFNLGAGSYNVEDGDEIIFYLGAMDALTWAPKTYIPQVSIDSSEIEEGDSVIININARKYDYPLGLTDLTIDEKSQIGEYTLCIGEETYTSSSGVITLYDVQKGTVVFTVSNVSGSGYPDVVTFKGSFLVKEKSSSGGGTPVKPKSISVKIAVIGEDGDILYGPGSVTLYEDDPYGMSALGALDVTGLSWSFHDSFDGFVSEIEGEENRGSSGWQYKVNGSIPNSLAENKILKKGDKVIWWYGSASSKGPDWDDLEDGNINSSKDDEVLEEKEEEIEGMPAEQVRKTFPDLGQNWDWAKDAIEILAGQGIIEGTGSGFEPGRHITRAEFIKLLVKALQLDLQLDIEDYQENLFQDVKSGDWFAQAVACAQKNGIIEGDPDRRFRPHDKISRNEIAAILYRLLETTIPTLEMNSLPFSDVEKVPAWAANGVKYAFQAGLMQGYQDQTFRGGNALNRAEAAVVIYRYLQEISN